jgi:hypothetical protein
MNNIHTLYYIALQLRSAQAQYDVMLRFFEFLYLLDSLSSSEASSIELSLTRSKLTKLAQRLESHKTFIVARDALHEFANDYVIDNGHWSEDSQSWEPGA